MSAAANKVATVKSAVVPGLSSPFFSSASNASEERARRGLATPRARSRRHALAPVRRSRSRDLHSDMGVGSVGEEGHMNSRHAPLVRQALQPGPAKCYQADMENLGELGDISAGDPVPSGGGGHCHAQIDRGRGGNVVPVGLSPGRRGRRGEDGCEGICCIGEWLACPAPRQG